MIDVSPFLAAYGLTPADLSDERKRQIGVIFTEAAKSAGGTAIQVGTRILQEEAAKRGIKTGTIGSTESTEAGKQVQAEIQKVQEEEEKAKLRKTLLISGISLVVVGVVIAVVVRLRPKSKR